ncbi:radical SAM protein [Candidatus Saganbacteria bacterium]|nr:radical SAM protein [Candidatus Saganbacteria bacterium]
MQQTPQALKEKIDQILPLVRRPARYIGNELNSIHKDWDKTAIKIAIGYPDLYEVGMSNLGIQILYHILNFHDDVLCERFFCPANDLAEQLTANGLPLFSLESCRPLGDFDMLGLSVGHELTYTNIITILKLSNISIFGKDRSDTDPLVFAGGPSTFNPMPIEDFVDFFVIGEAEEVILEIVQVVTGNEGRVTRLKKLSEIQGVYVPSIGNKTKKRYVKDLDSAPYPIKPIVPFLETIHDRAVIEVMRGCKHGCKFCSAFCDYRPVRERKAETVLRLAREIIQNTGYEELSLISLSSSDYSEIEPIARILSTELAPKKINVALPSLRLDSLGVKLMKEIQRVRPTSVTVAPEAGTDRLRGHIRKNLTEEQILSGARVAFSEGITSIKLYFMIGLPTEKVDDLYAIANLAKKVIQIGLEYSHKAHVTAAVSTFIPKPHTPFEREKQISLPEILERQQILRQNVRGRGLELRWHDAKTSIIEGVFSRGDKRLSKVIEQAWNLGARLDAWSENFKFEQWEQAFKNCGISMDEYLRERAEGEALPWGNISCSL